MQIFFFFMYKKILSRITVWLNKHIKETLLCKCVLVLIERYQVINWVPSAEKKKKKDENQIRLTEQLYWTRALTFDLETS